MAPAVSANATSAMEPAWHAEGVTIGDVLDALSGIRRKFALTDAGVEEQPHPRNCVMTLVGVATSEADERRAQRASVAIAARHPALVIVVREEPRVRGGRLNASITTHALNPSSESYAQCELVSLHVHGAAGEHLAALLDPLLLSGVPTYMWWLDTPPFGKKELLEALRICDSLVVDSARFDRPYDSFIGLAALAVSRDRRLSVADFQWARLAPWRETIAQFFEPADRRAFIAGIAELGIDYVGNGRGNRIAAATLIGWFASALGWKVERAVGGAGGILVAHYTIEGGRQLEVAFRSVNKANLAHGEISAVRISGASAGSTFRLSIQRDPERKYQISADARPQEFLHQHLTGGDDDAGLEVAQRKAAQHREVVMRNREALHHTATGNLPGGPAYTSTVLARERRGAENPLVLLTMIDLGGAETLRHVQRVEAEDEATLLLELLSTGANDVVYARSLAAAADLMRAVQS